MVCVCCEVREPNRGAKSESLQVNSKPSFHSNDNNEYDHYANLGHEQRRYPQGTTGQQEVGAGRRMLFDQREFGSLEEKEMFYFWNILGVTICVGFVALIAGLFLGLLTLDVLDLRIILNVRPLMTMTKCMWQHYCPSLRIAINCS